MTSSSNIVDMWHIMYLRLKISRPREGRNVAKLVCECIQGEK